MGMNLIEKLGLEKCKAIVGSAPSHWDTCFFNTNNGEFTKYIPSYNGVNVNDLRTAIADHERTDKCSDIRNHINPLTKVSER